MRLKILILPTFIVLEVIIVIAYIKPNVDIILEKRNEIVAAKEALTKVDTVQGNIQSITQSLRARSEAVGFVNRYYPMALDEERVVDALNYLAQQTGTVVAKVEVTQMPPAVPAGSTYNDLLNAGLSPEEATAQSIAAALAAPKDFVVRVGVLGEYANIKDFFNRVRHADRLHAVKEFSIARLEKTNQTIDEETIPGNFLFGVLEADFPYVGRQRSSDVLNDPLFQSNTFDFRVADQAITFVASPLPALDAGATGRTNPFE